MLLARPRRGTLPTTQPHACKARRISARCESRNVASTAEGTVRRKKRHQIMTLYLHNRDWLSPAGMALRTTELVSSVFLQVEAN